MSVDRTVEFIARKSYGRLLAYLATRLADIAVAEDALSEAFFKALKVWREKGVPQNPEAWILVTARNRLIDLSRSQQSTEALLKFLEEPISELNDEKILDASFPDERLKLMFVCAHPSIETSLHTPLMLQTILGLSAAQIASTFLTSPTTMSQRLVRAKSKIKKAGISFQFPKPSELPQRIDSVLDAVYAAYTVGWESLLDSDSEAGGLRDEALYLAKLCSDLIPNNAEAKGLLALILYCESRSKARKDANNNYVPLSEQDTNLWQKELIKEAEHELIQAAKLKCSGRFQIEAAIQSVHAHRAITGQTEWNVIVDFYEVLFRLFPSTGAQIGLIAAKAELLGAEAGLMLLTEPSSETMKSYQPYWSLKAHLHKQLGQNDEAYKAYLKAIGLTKCPLVKKFLLQKIK